MFCAVFPKNQFEWKAPTQTTVCVTRNIRAPVNDAARTSYESLPALRDLSAVIVIHVSAITILPRRPRLPVHLYNHYRSPRDAANQVA